jgi:hypothetical protein
MIDLMITNSMPRPSEIQIKGAKYSVEAQPTVTILVRHSNTVLVLVLYSSNLFVCFGFIADC